MDQPISEKTLRQRRKTLQKTILAGILTLAGGAWVLYSVIVPTVNFSEITISEVTKGEVNSTINASGIVIPSREELIVSPAQSRVISIKAQQGETVKAGDLIMMLDNRSLQVAVNNLREQLSQQELTVNALTLDMTQKIRQIHSAIELLELELKSAEAKWSRYKQLRVSGAVSGEDMLNAEMAVSRYQIQLRQQAALIEDTRNATKSTVESARSQKSIYQKQLDQQMQLLARTEVRAPFDGVLSFVQTPEGSSVSEGQLVAKISEPGNYKVEASVSDFHALSLQPGQTTQIEQGALKLRGKVQTIFPEVQNGVMKLLVELDAPRNPSLRPKLRVDVIIITERKSGLIFTGGPAISGRGQQKMFVVKDGVAKKTMVNIGVSDGKVIEVLAGAKAHDRLIVSDTSRFSHLDSIRVSN